MQDRRAFLVIFAIAAALVIPAALTLRTVIHPVILQATSAIVRYPDWRARLVVCLSTRSAVSQKSVLANDRGINAGWFSSRSAVWQRFLRLLK